MRFLFLSLIAQLFIFSCQSQEHRNKESEMHFEFKHFNDSIFITARKEQKPVLLHLRANWCHWCHVMEKETYADQNIQKFLIQNYIYTMEDHDDRADLTSLYGQYGWPATLIFSPKGQLVFAEAGYIEKDEMLSILNQFIVSKNWTDQSQNEEIRIENKNESEINEKISMIENQVFQSLDKKAGGFNSEHKFLEFATFNYAYSKIENSDELKNWLRVSVENSYNLNDKVWGGIYQYSTHRDWNHLHYEKLLQFQGDYIQMYLQYYQKFNDERALQYAKAISRYVKKFLTPKNETGFFNAQDADLIQGKKADDYFSLNNTERLKSGIPAIDSNIYTNSSMQYSTALLKLYQVTKDSIYLKSAQKTIDYLIENRLVENLMQHSTNTSNIKNLTDQIYTIRALWLINEITKNKTYKTFANKLLEHSITMFFDPKSNSLNAFIGKTALSGTYNATENMTFALMLKEGIKQNMITGEKYQKIYLQLMDFLTNQKLMQNYISEAALVNACE